MLADPGRDGFQGTVGWRSNRRRLRSTSKMRRHRQLTPLKKSGDDGVER